MSLVRKRVANGSGVLNSQVGRHTTTSLQTCPSRGGAGLFAERYGLGRFQPGDEGQATIAAYAEYPAVYSAIVVQQALLGLEVETGQASWSSLAKAPGTPSVVDAHSRTNITGGPQRLFRLAR